jgi:hypothetical protein
MKLSEDFSFTDLTQSSSAKLYRGTDNLFRFFFNSLSFYRFPAYSSWQQSSFCAKSIRTVTDIAHFFGPSAPYAILAVDNSIFRAFE